MPPGEAASADLDGDGDADLAVANRDANSVSIFINNTCQPKTGVPGDANGDLQVNTDDLLNVINAWGATGPNPADVTGDAIVNVEDILLVIANWT